MLDEIQIKYKLDNTKIIATATDNGSNFMKAFKEYGVKLKNLEVEEEEESSDSEGESNYITFEDFNDSQSQFKHLPLPKHYRCASHIINLIATTDANNAINSNALLRSRHEKVLQKCSVLWNKAGRPKSAEIIQKVLGHTLSYPSITRWNSFYNSISQILAEKEKLQELFKTLEIKDGFKESEIQYLEEYCKILKPLAETLNFLQGQDNTYYGYLLPSIISLKVKLEKLRSDLHLKVTTIILEKIILGVNKRFSHFFNINEQSKDAIIAAITIPDVKVGWLNVFKETDNTANFKTMIEIIVNHSKDIFNYNDFKIGPSETTEESVDKNEFFDFNEDPMDPFTLTSGDSEDTTGNNDQYMKNKIRTLELS